MIFILRVMVECRNVKAERIAKYLDRLAEGFKIWTHDEKVYAMFEIPSLSEVRELIKRLRRAKKAEFELTKIQTVREA